MICTITSETLTAATSSGAFFFYEATTIGLLIFLAIKEFASSSENKRLEPLIRRLNMAIIPLFVTFCLTLFIALE